MWLQSPHLGFLAGASGGCHKKCSTPAQVASSRSSNVPTLQDMMKPGRAFNVWNVLPELTGAEGFFMSFSNPALLGVETIPQIKVARLALQDILCREERMLLCQEIFNNLVHQKQNLDSDCTPCVDQGLERARTAASDADVLIVCFSCVFVTDF